MCIFEAKEVFCQVRFFDETFVESWSEHHCAPFWPKNLLDLTIFRKVASKSTVYSLFWLAFLRPKKCFSKYALLMKFCSILHQSSIVDIFNGKNCLNPFFVNLLRRVQSIACLDLNFWGQKSFVEVLLFDEGLVDSLSEPHCAPFSSKNLLDLTIFRRFASKSTVYSLSWCAFLRPKWFFSKCDLLMKV